MNAKQEYRDRVTAYLRDGYGASDFDFERGRGEHTKLIFDLNGKRCSLLLNDNSNSGPAKAIDLKLQDIRRLFGDPVISAIRHQPRRTLAGMTAELKPLGNGAHPVMQPQPQEEVTVPSKDSTDAQMAKYTDGKTVFMLPPGTFSPGTAIAVNRLSEHCWRLRKGDGTKVKEVQGKFLLVTSRAALVKGLPPFGLSPVEYRQVNSFTAEVTLIANQMKPVAEHKRRKPVAEHKRRKPVTDKRGAPPDVVFDTTKPIGINNPSILVPSRQLDDPRREALRLIREVETTSEYRLRKVKLDDGREVHEWYAPRIRLEC